MKFVVIIITKLCLLYMIPTQSRHDQIPYSTGNTVYRGVLGCGENSTGEVIYNPPENAQAYESYTIPVTGCTVTVSTCFDGVGDDIGFNVIIQGGMFNFMQIRPSQPDTCPADGAAPGNSRATINTAALPDVACDGSTDGLILIRVSPFDDEGSGNYTISLECDVGGTNCTVCPIDPEMDILQQLEDAKNTVSPAPVSSDSSSDDSSSDDDARLELERMDEHDIFYQYEHGQDEGTNDNEEKHYLLKVSQSVWINVYSILAVMILSCAIFCVCMYRKK